MSSFIHIADARNAAGIRRGGLPARRHEWGGRGVYCTPVVANYQRTFQWARELRGRGYRQSCAIQFRIGDDERVLVGRFGASPEEMSAAEATALFSGIDEMLGWQVILPRGVAPRDIHSVRPVNRLTGWLHHPEAKERRESFWPYPGGIKARRRRARLALD